jgi:hypothetical protein
MPKQVLPSRAEFDSFDVKMRHLGFRQITRGEVRTDQTRLGLKNPRIRLGREIGFVLAANGYQVVVWTTFLHNEGVARKSDAGHVMIKEGDTVLYHFHPTHRTKNFLSNMLTKANIAKERTLCRPLCPKCQAYMDIKRGKGLKARYYQCSKGHSKVNVSWDFGLHPSVLKEVEKLRRRRESYRKLLLKSGKKPGVALSRRKRWKITNPSNMV